MPCPHFQLSLFAALLLAGPSSSSDSGDPLQLPTPNHALFLHDQQEEFFVGTVGRTWESGTFGCVRSEGYQFHEGLDIRALKRDDRGEPVDPILASAEGTVVYLNDDAWASNYGKYIVLAHSLEGLEFYSLYAHLSVIDPALKINSPVSMGRQIATMGRTANTRHRISKERAHLHFEIALMLNDRFETWHARRYRGAKNHHGRWNGQNLIGIDPAALFRQLHQSPQDFSLLEFIRNQTGLCRVVVPKTDFSWLRRYPKLVKRNPIAEREGAAAYEIAFTYFGLPYQLIPRAASEVDLANAPYVLSVDQDVYKQNQCERMVDPRDGEWVLSTRGKRLLDLLLF